MMTVLEALPVPIVGAPMAGGPTTPQLVAAVNRAGGLGFLAAGYLTAQELRATLLATRECTDRPFGVNVFVGSGQAADPHLVAAYAARLAGEVCRADARLGDPRFDDDSFDEKVAVLLADPVAAVSFTFGLPSSTVIDELRGVGSEVWATVTSPDEAAAAAQLGAEALVVQGLEAGGHRGVFVDDESASELTLLAALQLVRAQTALPLVAAGSIMTGAALAAVLAAGASAGQLGTAYLRSPEAGTSTAQRRATAGDDPTVLTRAFSGRLARGIVNRLHRDHGAAAPQAYPELHHLTAPLRAHGRHVGDADLINLWAGEAHHLAQDLPAESITAELWRDASTCLAQAARRWGP